MKLTKFFAILGLGLCLMATSCSKDEDKALTVEDVCGTYSGVFTVSLSNAPYATDNTEVKVEKAGNNLVNITFAEVTGSPASPGRPASKMTNLKLTNVKLTLNGTTASFAADPVEGAGMMNGKSAAINHSKISGTFANKKLKLNLDFSFGRMYEMMKALLNGKYEGTKK